MPNAFLRIFTHFGGVAETDEELREKQLRAAYQYFFSTDQGKMILDDLANKFNFLAPSYTGNAEEALFAEGGRNVVLYILGMVRDDFNNPIREVTKI